MNFNDAIKQRMANKYNNWSSIGSDSDPSAAKRFSDPFFYVHNSPRFKLKREVQVYTIGSCFARNVEAALLKRGMNVPTTTLSIDPSFYKTKPHFHNTALNKYNPHTMAAEILRGIGKLHYPDRGLVEIGKDRFYDPQSSHTGALDRTSVVALRDELDRVNSLIASSQVFVFTLGLVETWFDKSSKIAYNQMDAMLLRPLRNDLEFKAVSAIEAVDVLSLAFTELKIAVPEAKVIVTVSPVPLLNTFSGADIVTANTYSKSSLMVAAHILAEKFDFVDYYPSYEMVTNSPRSTSWAQDQAHVTPQVVDKVIENFILKYFD